MRGVISQWNKERQTNSRLLIDQKKGELEELQTCPDNDITLITKTTEELKKAYRDEEAYWRQRSRLLWLRLGDRNSGVFHAASKKRKRINALSLIEDIDGNPVYQEGEIAQVIVSYFQALFTSISGNRKEIVELALHPIITDEDNVKLTMIPNSIEIKKMQCSLSMRTRHQDQMASRLGSFIHIGSSLAEIL